jgi:formamidopyrimidine-DNA glycosylase
MYGFIGLYMNHLIDSPYYQAAITRPSPLSPEFDEVYFDQLIKSASPKLSAKAFLATEQRIPGLGNGLLQDILFFSGIHPKRKISSFSAADSSRLYDVIKIQTKKIAAAGGRDTEKDLYGNPGGYHTALSSKTWKAPCPVCGGVITKQAYLGGSVYFCSFCQPLD